jgi:hypothetical protein
MYKKALIFLVTTFALQSMLYAQFGETKSLTDPVQVSPEPTTTFGESSGGLTSTNEYRTKKAGGGPPDNPDGPISDYSYLLVGAVGLFFLRRKK